MNLPHFSYDSLVLMTIVNLVTTGSVMLFIWNADRPGPGLKQMALGDLVVGFGLLAFALKTVIPGGAMILFPNLAVFAGAMLMLNGVRAFRGYGPVPAWLAALAFAIYACVLTYATFVNNNLGLRVSVGSIALGTISASMMAAMLASPPRDDRQLYYFSGALFGLHAFSLGLRALLGGPTLDVAVIFTLNLVVTGCCLGVATASSRKLYHSTRKLALHDPLTQLPNRRMFEDRLADLCRLPVRPFVALIYLDLDNFKVVNETFGHRGGDQVLQVVGERLLAQSARDGFPARIGGDEFVVVLENAKSRPEVLSLMGSLIRAIRTEIRIGQQGVLLEVSGGVALFPEDAETLPELLDVADRCMYRAKRRQRKFAPFTDPITTPQFSPTPKSL